MAKKAVLLDPACLKRLSEVEANPDASNQHEFNGVAELKSILGTSRCKVTARFSVRDLDVADVVDVTWYDSRENDPKRSAEFRLYFQANAVMDLAKGGDDILIGLDKDGVLNLVLFRS